MNYRYYTDWSTRILIGYDSDYLVICNQNVGRIDLRNWSRPHFQPSCPSMWESAVLLAPFPHKSSFLAGDPYLSIIMTLSSQYLDQVDKDFTDMQYAV